MPMRDHEVNAILNRVEEGQEAPRNLIRFDIGETVQVTDGPFEGFSGMVEDVDEAHSRLKSPCRSSAGRRPWNWNSLRSRKGSEEARGRRALGNG